ncbi:ABC transporter permease [Rhizocola hellebori]|uniref:ABC transporter permease n=1 Tax=Rhizocola hellebori TaxID=1392758 RepID=A0A8J3Q2A3_9ACTN|nr:iron ABC transporter permease [Rhizocola hellebori]GIH02061.1 ABC transporter permease [Rhizocola hellebori]
MKGYSRLGLVAVALAVAVVASVSVGEVSVPPIEVVKSLLFAGTDYDLIVRELRWPRTVLAVVTGAAFGIGGALIQSVTRNPLASPDIIGITQGAGLAATIALTTGVIAVAPAALAGGLLAALLVFTFGSRSGFSARRFVLAGVAVAFALRAGIEVVLTSAETIDAQRAQIWLIGSLNGRGFTEASAIALTLVLALGPLLWAGWALRTSALDDDVARGLGVRPVARRYGLAAVGVVLAAAATAQVGAIDFVALVAPQVARRILRTERPGLLASALVGATLVVLADLAGRRLLAPTQLPAGVLTAALGAPYLIYLLLRGRRHAA